MRSAGCSKVQETHHLPVERGDSPLAFHGDPEWSQSALSADFAHHFAGLTLNHGLYGVGAEPGCETAVCCGRTSTALDVAEDADTVFVSAELLELFSDSEGTALDTLGHNDDAAGLAAMTTSAEPLAHGPAVHRVLGNQDFLGSARHADGKRELAGMPAHYFDKKESLVRVCGVAHFVDGIDGRIDGGVEAECEVGAEQIVVEGPGMPMIWPRQTFAKSIAPRNVPSPPMSTSASTPSFWRLRAAFLCPFNVRNSVDRAVFKMVPPRWMAFETERASISWNCSCRMPSYPRLNPSTRKPCPRAMRVTERMAAFMPGASPPLVIRPRVFMGLCRSIVPQLGALEVIWDGHRPFEMLVTLSLKACQSFLLAVVLLRVHRYGQWIPKAR